ncbi:hypothetical protein JXL83_07230 [candidate division WOR-3 bacterium]|nr:hypothetical protein [candidate division WOR-3 bacterium]
MTPEEIEKKIREKLFISEGKECLKCAEAFDVASELGIEPSEIGRICNRLKIKIVSCQLGCFN